jgi:hypothetical protein
VALLGWCSAAFKSSHRDKWIGWSKAQQLRRLRYIANNSRFLILPGIRIKNLASRTLALNLRRLSSDWIAAYDHPILLAETFIDHTRFTGACYRAAGFVPLGETLGFGRNNGKYYIHGQAKTIMVRPLRRKAREHLSAPFEGPALLGRSRPLVDLNRLATFGPGGLTERLASLKDPRFARGVRHSRALAVIACACLSGARSYLDLGRFSASLPQDLLHRLGRRIAETTRYRVPPSEPTLRRALGYTTFAGAQVRYLVHSPQGLVAVFGFSASAWQVRDRDSFIGWNGDQRRRFLYLVANNSRFLILPWIKCQNLASRLLSLVVRRLPGQACYNEDAKV